MKPDLKSLYRDTLLMHSRAPSNRNPLPDASTSAKLKNPLCGDLVSIHLKTENDRITQASFEAQSCSICMASASMLTEKVIENPIQEVQTFASSLIEMISDPEKEMSLPNNDLNALSGVKDFPSRIRCATLPWEALLAALAEKMKGKG